MKINSLQSLSFSAATELKEAAANNLPYGLTRPFPAHWSSPPEIQTRDWVQLPAGFGYGSSTLKSWIYENMRKDAPGLEKNFPVEWGAPPEIQTCDWVELPENYGMGSSTLRSWILKNLNS